MSKFKLDFTEHTEVGHRPKNEDYCASYTEGDWGIFIVADGLGGYPGGELASQYFCQALVEYAALQKESLKLKPEQAMQQLIIDAANNSSKKLNGEQLSEASTTCAIAWVDPNKIVTAHIGDSRVILLDKQKVLWRSKDHSRVQELVDQGVISERDMGLHPEQWELYRSITPKQTPKPDVFVHPPLKTGQLLLLCTDGFWSMTTPAAMLSLAKCRKLNETVVKLAEKAVKKADQDSDNVTAIAARLAK